MNRKSIFFAVLISIIVSSCCSLKYPELTNETEVKHINLIKKMISNPDAIEDIALDTAISTSHFYKYYKDIGIDEFKKAFSKFDCNTQFVKNEPNAVKSDDGTFKQGYSYYFKSKDIGVIFTYMMLKKKWYLDEIVLVK